MIQFLRLSFIGSHFKSKPLNQKSNISFYTDSLENSLENQPFHPIQQKSLIKSNNSKKLEKFKIHKTFPIKSKFYDGSHNIRFLDFCKMYSKGKIFPSDSLERKKLNSAKSYMD